MNPLLGAHELLSEYLASNPALTRQEAVAMVREEIAKRHATLRKNQKTVPRQAGWG